MLAKAPSASCWLRSTFPATAPSTIHHQPGQTIGEREGKTPSGINSVSRAWEHSPAAASLPWHQPASPLHIPALPFIIKCLNNQSSPWKTHLSKSEREERRVMFAEEMLCWQVVGPGQGGAGDALGWVVCAGMEAEPSASSSGQG